MNEGRMGAGNIPFLELGDGNHAAYFILLLLEKKIYLFLTVLDPF